MTYEQVVDQLFWFCVGLLEICADALGVSYEEINIYVFVVLMPGVILGQAIYIRALKRRHAPRPY